MKRRVDRIMTTSAACRDPVIWSSAPDNTLLPRLRSAVAEAVRRQNVVASTDCGLGGRLHPQIAWAKLAALAEGANSRAGNSGDDGEVAGSMRALGPNPESSERVNVSRFAPEDLRCAR